MELVHSNCDLQTKFEILLPSQRGQKLSTLLLELFLTIPMECTVSTKACCHPLLPSFCRLMWLFNPSSCHQVGKVVSSKGGIVIDGSIFLLPSKPMLEVLKEGEVEPNYLDFLDRIEEAAHIGDKEKTGISAGIIHRDFVTIENAWENYVHVNPQSMLSVLTVIQSTLKRKKQGFDHHESLN